MKEEFCNMLAFLRILLLLIFSGLSMNAFAQEIIPETKEEASDESPPPAPTILKADEVDGNRITNVVTATGNVELTRGNSIIYSDQMSYDKNSGYVTANGNIRAKNIEVGKLRSSNAVVKDDFSKGTFLNNTLVLNDGSYLVTPKSDRLNENITVLKKPIYSLCPDENISKDDLQAGKKRDLLSIKSSEATINKEENTIKLKHGFFRIYNVPVFYLPYAKFPLPNNKRRTGFLSPSYIKNNRFGIALKTPFFVDIAPNMDLTISPQYYLTAGQYTINNDFRHMTKNGKYNLNFEISNNTLNSTTDKTVVNRTNQNYRWLSSGQGKFEFDEKNSFSYNLNKLGDRNYLRDYNFNFAAYTVSEAHFEHTQGREYYGLSAISIQELIDTSNPKQAPFVLPSFDSYIESKPNFLKGKTSLASNLTVIERFDGLQYRRASLTPAANIPLNLHGNMFNFGARMQSDFYSLENNFHHSAETNNFDSTQSNYKPEVSVSWRLPLIQKTHSNTFLIEPIANFVSSTFMKNYQKLPNEDSNNSELTVNNLFVNDRIAGFDRNEAGQRFSYGVKSSMFNKLGQFGLTIGQSYRLVNKTQDVSIRGFNANDKSNIVGEFSYKYKTYFNTIYAYQLNESNYRNDVNSVTANLTLKRFSIGGNYLLLRKTISNLQEVEQISGSTTVNLTEKLSVSVGAARDMAIKRTISRTLNINYGGCCVIFTFSATENNSTNLIKPQTSYKINVTIKNI